MYIRKYIHDWLNRNHRQTHTALRKTDSTKGRVRQAKPQQKLKKLKLAMDVEGKRKANKKRLWKMWTH